MIVPTQLANMAVKDVHATEMDSDARGGNPVAKMVADYRKSKETTTNPRAPPLAEIRTDVRDVAAMPASVSEIPAYIQAARQFLATYPNITFFSTLLGIAETAMDQQLKRVYFMAQVNMFAPVFDLLTPPSQSSKVDSAVQEVFYPVNKFSARYGVHASAFTDLILAQALQLKPTEPEEMRTFYLRTKDHLEGVRAQLWEHFFTTRHSLVQKFVKDLLSNYSALIEEFRAVLELLIDTSPVRKIDTLRELIQTAFQDKSLDTDFVTKIVRPPAQQRSILTMDGPVLICEYLRRKDLCDQVKLTPELFKDLQPFFEQLAILYAEFHTKLFQIGMRASMLFVKEINAVNDQLYKNTRALDEHQRKLTSELIATNNTSASFGQYLTYIHSLFISKATQSVLALHNQEVKSIQEMMVPI